MTEITRYAADYGVTVPTDPVGIHTSVTAPTGHALQPTNNIMGGGRAFGYGAEDEREVTTGSDKYGHLFGVKLGTRTGWILSLALAGVTSFFVIKWDLSKNIMKGGWVATIFAFYIVMNINK